MLLFDEPRRTQATTFAEPDDGKSFVQRSMAAIDASLAGSEAFKLNDQTLKDVAGGVGRVLEEPRRTFDDATSGSLRRIAAAAWDQYAYVETSVSNNTAREESYERIIKAIKSASGVALDNPWRGGFDAEARAMARQMQADTPAFFRQRDQTFLRDLRIQAFDAKANELAENDPRIFEALNTARVDQSPDMIARRADAEMREANNAARSVVGSLGAALVGGIVPAMREPINIAGLLFGAGPSAAKTVAGRLFDVALREAMINGGITAVQQPFVQDWRREAGLEAGVAEGAQNVAMAVGFGALFGAGAQGLREVMPRAAVGDASVKEVRAALKEAGVKLDTETTLVLRAAEATEQADDLVMKSKPAGLPDDEAREVLAQAVRRAEDPINEPMPEIPVDVRPVNPARARVTDESLPVNIGDVDMVDNKPVSFQKFDPANLTTDARVMQYKGGGDEAGVTDRLRSVTRWDPLAGGRVFVFERLDGTQVIADGHQRMGLAKRIQAEDPEQKVELVGHLFREADGWSAADVRAMAAKKNMQEGSGTPLDAARILRDKPDIADGSLPKGGTVVRDGLFLARLSDPAFDLVNAGVVPEAIGARVGALAPDPVTHLGIMNDLVRFKPETQREADLFIGESLRAGFVLERQEDMFGVMEATVSLMGERVRVLNDTIKLLASDKRVFAGLERNAATIESAGNQLARDSNQALAAQAAGLQDMIVKLAQRMGPISDALNEQALALKNGAKPAEAARAFAARVQTLIERDGLAALLAEPQLRPTSPVAEPGTPQALAAAERVEVDPFTMDMFGAPPARPAGITIDELFSLAPVIDERMRAAGAAIAAEVGAKFKAGPIKVRADAEAKMVRKGYDDASRLTDIVRGGFTVTEPGQADAIVAGLASRYKTVTDEGWFTTPAGYIDRKVIAIDEAGVPVEFQLWEPTMLAAKDQGGHRLYTQSRALPVGDPVRQDLQRQQLEIYSAAAAGLSEDWKAALGIAGKSGNNLLNSSTLTSRADMPTSASSTRDQPSLMTDQASPGSQMAGRPSQTQVFMDTSSSDTMNVMQNATVLSSEKTRAGEQTLIPGVAAVTDQQRMAVEASRPLQGGNAAPPAGGLFDDGARQQADLMDQLPLPSRDDPSGTRLASRQDALVEAEQLGFGADLVKACKT
jgi:hypothetical protein